MTLNPPMIKAPILDVQNEIVAGGVIKLVNVQDVYIAFSTATHSSPGSNSHALIRFALVLQEYIDAIFALNSFLFRHENTNASKDFLPFFFKELIALIFTIDICRDRVEQMYRDYNISVEEHPELQYSISIDGKTNNLDEYIMWKVLCLTNCESVVQYCLNYFLERYKYCHTRTPSFDFVEGTCPERVALLLDRLKDFNCVYEMEL